MSTDNTRPTSLEYLPVETFLKIFASLSLQEIVTAFSGLNSYIESIIRSLRDKSHAVRYNDTKAIDLMYLFSAQIGCLVLKHPVSADFTSLINL
jgi:hypothetical protein